MFIEKDVQNSSSKFCHCFETSGIEKMNVSFVCCCQLLAESNKKWQVWTCP